jgi:membrane associated rhomboid family serine protease
VFLFRHRNLFFVRDKQIGIVLLAWSALQVIGGFFSPQIDNWAHVGGLVGGAMVVIPMRPRLAGNPAAFEVR